MHTVIVVLLILGLACFVAEAVGVPSRVDLVAAGLACWILTALLPALT
jgi:hypothetical protein